MTIGSGTVIHPRATILALQGPITIGTNNIVEEMAVIVNRTNQPMTIGDDNLFQVGCRESVSSHLHSPWARTDACVCTGIESRSVGSGNTFEVRSKVAHTVNVGSYCTIGAACTVVPDTLWPGTADDLFNEQDEEETENDPAPSPPQVDQLPDRTVVYGYDARRHLWSGEGVRQQAALHAKHLEYLRDCEYRRGLLFQCSCAEPTRMTITIQPLRSSTSSRSSRVSKPPLPPLPPLLDDDRTGFPLPLVYYLTNDAVSYAPYLIPL